MKTIITCLAVFVAGCSSIIPGMGGRHVYELTNPASHDMSFSNDKIQIQFTISEESISISLKNTGPNLIKIVWDEAAIVVNGFVNKVRHSWMREGAACCSQPPTAIPQNATLMVNIYSVEGSSLPPYAESIQYDNEVLSGTTVSQMPGNVAMISSEKGRTFALYLPIKTNETVQGYYFEFMVSQQGS